MCKKSPYNQVCRGTCDYCASPPSSPPPPPAYPPFAPSPEFPKCGKKFCKKLCKIDPEVMECKNSCIDSAKPKKCKKKCRKPCLKECKKPGGVFEHECPTFVPLPPSPPPFPPTSGPEGTTAIPVTSDVTSADAGSAEFTYELISGGVASVALLALLFLASRCDLEMPAFAPTSPVHALL